MLNNFNKRIKFKPGVVSPICLPGRDLKDIPTQTDPELKAYIAGWGRMSPDAENGRAFCDTKEFGPSPHTVCSFPFSYKGEIIHGCAKIPSPSSHHVICRQFFEWAASKQLDLWNDKLNKSYVIKYWNKKAKKKSQIRCYSPATNNGWCGTCYDFKGSTTTANQEGYCKYRKKIGWKIGKHTSI